MDRDVSPNTPHETHESSGDDVAEGGLVEPSAQRRIGFTVFVGTALALVLVTVSLFIGQATAASEVRPTTKSAEAGFARDMQVHHEQAVEMSMIVRDRTDDPEVRLLAYDIATSQAQQAGQMYAWLATWDLPQASPEPPMSWMAWADRDDAGEHAVHLTDTRSDAGRGDPDALMPGMATRAQLEELRTVSGRNAERLFLTLMIAHHESGVDMAEAIVRVSRMPVVTDLARSMVATQRSEIDLMNELLAARSAP